MLMRNNSEHKEGLNERGHDQARPAPYPVNALGPLKEIVLAVKDATLAPVEIAAQSALAVASLVVNPHADVEGLDGTYPTSIFALTVAESGERKSSCDKKLMAPVEQHESQQAKRYHEVAAEYDRAVAAASKLKRSRSGDGSDTLSLEGTVNLPPRPRDPNRTVSEPTISALIDLLKNGQPSIGIFSDEGGQFFGGPASQKDNRLHTFSALNSVWDARPIKWSRKEGGTFTLYGRRVVVHFMAQPTAVSTFLWDSDANGGGLIARFLICWPPSNMGTRFHAHSRICEKSFATYNARVKEILDVPLPMDEETGALTVRTLELSDEARDVLIAYYDEVEANLADSAKYAGLKATAAKSAEQAVRLAGVLTLFADLQAEKVTGAQMKDAITLARYYLNEALRITNTKEERKRQDVAEHLYLWLEFQWPERAKASGRCPAHFTLRDIKQYAPNVLRKRDAANQAIVVLVRDKLLELVTNWTDLDGKTHREAYRLTDPPP